MWDCPACGCQAIAHGLAFCPMCGGDMPKTNSGGASNAETAQETLAGDGAGAETPEPGDGAQAVTELQAAKAKKSAAAPADDGPEAA